MEVVEVVDAGGAQDCEGSFALCLLARVAEDSANRWPGTTLVLPLGAHFPGTFRFCAFPRVNSLRIFTPFTAHRVTCLSPMRTNEQGEPAATLKTPIPVGHTIYFLQSTLISILRIDVGQ